MVLRWPKALFTRASTLTGKHEAALISHIHRESTLLKSLATILHSVREDFQESDGKSRERPRPELQNSLTPLVMEVWVVQFKQHAGIRWGTIQR